MSPPDYNISHIIADCKPGANYGPESQLACALGCQVEEPGLEEALLPWSSPNIKRLAPTLWHSMCRGGQHFSLAFVAVLRGGRLYWKCCSLPQECETGGQEVNGDVAQDPELWLQVVLDVARAARLPDMDFCFNTGDQPFTLREKWPPVPQLHWVSSPSYWGIAVPNPFHLKALSRNELGDASDSLLAHHIPWEERLDRVFWRGAVSGPDHILDSGIHVMPRLQLQRLARAHPDLFDIAFTDIDDEMDRNVIGGRKNKAWKHIKRTLNRSKHVDFRKELPRRKYVINVSAVLSSWRLIELIASGALLILQEDPTREVLYDWLVPWEHYVPVQYELSDLVPKLQWLRENDVVAKRIAAQGFDRFATRARREDIYCYVWRVLRSLLRIAGPAEWDLRQFREFRGKAALQAPGRPQLAELVDSWRAANAVEL